jgi:site-specific recombinase XerD
MLNYERIIMTYEVGLSSGNPLQRRSEIDQWIEHYSREELQGKDKGTIKVYLRVLNQFTSWIAVRPWGNQQVHLSQLTKSAFKEYIDELHAQDYSVSHMKRVKAIVRGFALWLVEQGELRADPTRGIAIPEQPRIIRGELTKEQRFILKHLVERSAQKGDLRSAALFALGYWAGCRVSEVSHLLVGHTEVGPQTGKLRIGHRESECRDILLIEAARAPLHAYLQNGKRASESAYVFTSQRKKLRVTEGELDGWRFTEDGIHQWFQSLKTAATMGEFTYIQDITFYDLRHDFACRARQEGNLSESELAIYLGQLTKEGLPWAKAIERRTHSDMGRILEKLGTIKD